MDCNTVHRLSTNRLFAEIDEHDIPHMLSCIEGTERRYKKDEYIFIKGDDLKRVA